MFKLFTLIKKFLFYVSTLFFFTRDTPPKKFHYVFYFECSIVFCAFTFQIISIFNYMLIIYANIGRNLWRIFFVVVAWKFILTHASSLSLSPSHSFFSLLLFLSLSHSLPPTLSFIPTFLYFIFIKLRNIVHNSNFFV